MELSYVTLDVFTSKRLEGNPLAVVSVPRALKETLSQETKQKIAREFNFSETVFLHEPSEGGGAPKELDINIFTVDQELPFAGHPTIGTAVLAKNLLCPSVERLITKAGPIGLSADASGAGIRASIPHDVRIHRKTLAGVVPEAERGSYPGLSHHQPEIRDAELRAPVVSIVKGMTYLLVKLPSLAVLAQVKARTLDFASLPGRLLDEDWPQGFVARYYYVEEESAGDDARHYRTRMVESGREDPATGSAASPLAAYLTLSMPKMEEGVMKFIMTQGVEMGRRSVIRVHTTAEDYEEGKRKIKDLWLGGEAVVVMKGKIVVDN